jgi:hypothetical protein
MNTVEQGMWKGAEALRPFLVPIDELRETEGNPRLGNVEEIALSLERFGQVRPVAVRTDGFTIVAGHHVTKAAKKLGWTHVACIPGDFADESEAIAYVLADNALVQLGTFDAEAYVQMAMPFANAGDLTGLGISMDAYEDQLALVSEASKASEAILDATYERSEDDDAAAERGALIAAYQQKREVVMLMELEEYERFGVHLRILRQEYGTDGVKDTVLQALEYEAYNRNQAEAQQPGEPGEDYIRPEARVADVPPDPTPEPGVPIPDDESTGSA